MSELRSALPGSVLDALRDAWALVLPVDCAGCQRPDRAMCAECIAQLTPAPVARVLADATPLVTALRYESVVRQTVLALKDHGRTDVAAHLGRALAAAVVAACATLPTQAAAPVEVQLELLPIPPSGAGLRRRGYDPVGLLLRAAGFRGVRVLAAARSSGQQKRLGASERAANRSGSLRARAPLSGRAFLLVDDVVTTGATLVEAARAVRDAGGEVVGAVALAYTPKLFMRLDDGSGVSPVRPVAPS